MLQAIVPHCAHIHTDTHTHTHTHLLPSVPNLWLGYHGNIVVLLELLILIHGQAWTTQQCEKKRWKKNGGACPWDMAHVSPVCLFTISYNKELCNIISNNLISLLCCQNCVFCTQQLSTKFHQIMNLSCDFPHGWSHTVFRAAEVC